jgi:hypothetical protein
VLSAHGWSDAVLSVAVLGAAGTMGFAMAQRPLGRGLTSGRVTDLGSGLSHSPPNDDVDGHCRRPTSDSMSSRPREGREAARVEAFSDGVMAVIITIMAFGLNVPEDTTWRAVRQQLPSHRSSHGLDKISAEPCEGEVHSVAKHMGLTSSHEKRVATSPRSSMRGGRPSSICNPGESSSENVPVTQRISAGSVVGSFVRSLGASGRTGRCLPWRMLRGAPVGSKTRSPALVSARRSLTYDLKLKYTVFDYVDRGAAYEGFATRSGRGRIVLRFLRG